MPITGQGWELLVIRQHEQTRADGRRRTVGTYQVNHNGVVQTGPDLSGALAEAKGPGANFPPENGRRIAPGRYPLWTQDGTKYKTWQYHPDDTDPDMGPKPALELKKTGARSEILIHPGTGFLASIGCMNPCTSLPDANERITYAGSRRRTISLIEDLQTFAGAHFPGVNGKIIPNAFVVVENEV